MGFKLGGCIERWEVEKRRKGGREEKGREEEGRRRREEREGERREGGRVKEREITVMYNCTTCRVSSIPYSHESSCTRLGRSILRVHQF